MNGKLSISQAEAYLQQLEQFHTEITHTRDLFNQRLNSYHKRVNLETRVDLESSVAHFEKYLLPFIIAQQGLEERPIEDGKILTVAIDGSWGAYEFRQLFESLDYLNKIYMIQTKLQRGSPDFRLQQGMTRSPIYRQSRLHYYLSSREELQVRQIEFASPGLVSFEGVGEIIKEVRELFDYIVTGQFIKRFIDTYHVTRDKEARKLDREARLAETRARIAESQAQRAEAVLREIRAKSLIKMTIRQIQEHHSQTNVEGLALGKLDSLAETAIRLEANGLARLSKVEDSIVDSVSMLHRLGYEDGKVKSLPSAKQ